MQTGPGRRHRGTSQIPGLDEVTHPPAASGRGRWSPGGGEVEGAACVPHRGVKVRDSRLGAPAPADFDPLARTSRSCCASPVRPGTEEETRGEERHWRPSEPSRTCRRALAAQAVPERRDVFRPSFCFAIVFGPESCNFPLQQEILPPPPGGFCSPGGVQDGERGE